MVCFGLVLVSKKYFLYILARLFFVECTRAEIFRRAKIAGAKFALKNMSVSIFGCRICWFCADGIDDMFLVQLILVEFYYFYFL